MTDTCDSEHKRNGELSGSDNDSLTLLHDLNPWQSKGAAQDTRITDFSSQKHYKEMEKKTEIKMNQLKPPELGMSTKSVAGSADSSSQMSNSKLKGDGMIFESTFHPDLSCFILIYFTISK